MKKLFVHRYLWLELMRGVEDRLRLYKSEKRASEVQRNRRKRKARERVTAEEAAVSEEGPGPAGEF